MNNDLISIIVPCYNVAKYLDKCMESLLNQTIKNYEIILVNDLSTDDTQKIIDKYVEKYSFVKAITNEKNSGAAASRNNGLKNSVGKYISFIDSDDYISNDYYEKLLSAMNLNSSDIAIADIKVVFEYDDNKTEVSPACNGKVTKLNIINTGLAASPCNKLFKREIISKYEFSVGRINEDIAVVLPSIIESKSISYVSDVFYYYIQRDNSVQNSKFSDKKFDVFYGVDLTLERIKDCENYEDISQAIIFNQLILLLIYVITKETSFKNRYSILKKYHKYVKKYHINKNKYFIKFLNTQGRYHKYYYEMLVGFNNINFNLLSNLLISMYHFYQKHLVKYAIKNYDVGMDDLIKLAKKQSKMKKNKKSISVVVPNYNYEKFLYQRLYSILYQEIHIDEIIILDDCSKDNSRELIDNIVLNLNDYINIKKVYNTENSGSAFKQWRKGFELAMSDYVWIAEADDYCSPKFLKTIIKPINKNNDILISYSDTSFIDAKGKIFMRTIKPEIDIMHTGHWDKSYINDGINEVNNYAFLNCTIANVSSIIIKKGDYSDYFEDSGEFKQAGDWLLYTNVMYDGKIAYSNKALNYYRVHGNNVTSVTKKQAHFEEIKRIHKYLDKKIEFNNEQKKEIEKRYDFLKNIWNVK